MMTTGEKFSTASLAAELASVLPVLRHYGVAKAKLPGGIVLEFFDGPSPSSLARALEESGITDDHPVGKKVIQEAVEYANRRYPELEEENEDEYQYPDG